MMLFRLKTDDVKISLNFFFFSELCYLQMNFVKDAVPVSKVQHHLVLD